MFSQNETVFVLIDVQGRLAEAMYEKGALFKNLEILVQGMQALGVPIIVTEQIPEKMGKTIPQLETLLDSAAPIAKSSFSCCGEQAFVQKLKQQNRKQVLLAGIETHVCVYQTASDLIDTGYHVEVAADAVSSRTGSNRQIGLEKMKACGARITSVETVLFELLKTADHPSFKAVLKLVK
ncbi:hydrolase [Verrucomicrobiota bacterium]